MYGIILIVVLIIIGGVTAFVGDRIGSKVGKKRMSLFGLRPRHTSIIVTILTGIAITTITFVILSITSKNVRTALFGMEKLQEKVVATQHDLAAAEQAIKAAHAEQQKTQKQLLKSHEDLLLAQQKTKSLQSRQALLQDINNRLSGENSRLESLNSSLDASNQRLLSSNAALKTSNGKLEQQNDELLKRNGDLSSKRIVYQAGELIFAATAPPPTDRGMAQDELSKLIAIANEKVRATLGTNNLSGREGIWIYPIDYENAVKRLFSDHKDMVIRFVAAANIVQGEPVRTNIELYPNHIVYMPNQLVTQEEFVLNGTQQSAQEAIFAFLQSVNHHASKKGILPDPLHGSIGVINMDQLYNIIDAMSPLKGYVLLTAYSRGETDVLGPLHLILKVEQLHEE